MRNKLWVRLFRRLGKSFLRSKGYTAEQADRLIGKLGDGTILEWLEKYGPQILKILLLILPLFMMMEQPAGEPDTAAAALLAELDDDTDLFDSGSGGSN